MPKPVSSNPKRGPALQGVRYQPNWVAALGFLLIGALLTVAFLDYSPAQSLWITTHPTERNLVGFFGSTVAYWTLHWIGVSTWLVPVLLLWSAWVAVRNARRLALTRAIAMALAILSFSSLWAMWESFGVSQYFPQGTGGLLGRLVYGGAFKETLGVFGSLVLLGLLYGLSLLFIFSKDISAGLDRLIAGLNAWLAEHARVRAERRALLEEARRSEQAARLEASRQAAKAAPAKDGGAASGRSRSGSGDVLSGLSAARKAPAASAADAAVSPPAQPPEPDPLPPPEPHAGGQADSIIPLDAAQPEEGDLPPAAESAPRPSPTPSPRPPPEPPLAGEAPGADVTGRLELNIVKPEQPKKARTTVAPVSDEGYQFPPLALLREQAPLAAENSEEEHRRNAENLLRILGEFGVQVSLGEIHVGPVITRYEVVPAPGVRVEKIAGLDKNIALGMRAQSVRILAPIPGKAAVGVEVPNQHPTPVGMREILESEDWSAALTRGEIPIALGKDVSGKPIVSDLTKMPHLLIAGATGSGKSVCINSIIASILYSKSPKDLRLLMVDPKIVELKVFNSLPHMLIPVVTEPKKVPAALKWLLGEMEQRYQVFAKVGVRNIVGFNGRRKPGVAEEPAAPDAQGALAGIDPAADDGIEVPERLPYIVAIIDELADLMMVAAAEIETSIARLAQLARAAGIHLIIATQRPSVNVITGVIKANLPSRIAFQVASQVDSRTILDTKGADTLIGRGDMLFSPPGTSRLVRAQGAFVSDEEVHEIVAFMRKNGPPVFASDVQAQIDRAAREEDEGEEGETDGDLGDDEELYRQALDVLRSTRRASTSMIQRRLRIGYNRAARLMDLMEDKGIVGPENGSSPREILVDLDNL
ncbi:MAG: DNA translocase FtsK [Verrucomicrobia bacterium]|nr:DNA translocase FtsK [Verrucomicrobiota bacterium]